MEEKVTLNEFQQELKMATTQRETSMVVSSSQATDRSIQLLRQYDDMRHDPPASTAINSSLPSSVTQTRANTRRPFGLLTDGSGDTHSSNEIKSSNQEARLLLTEWTSTTDHILIHYLDDDSNGDSAGPASEGSARKKYR